jgi:hypothetical protein
MRAAMWAICAGRNSESVFCDNEVHHASYRVDCICDEDIQHVNSRWKRVNIFLVSKLCYHSKQSGLFPQPDYPYALDFVEPPQCEI